MRALSDRHAEIAERSEQRSRSMLSEIREAIAELAHSGGGFRFEDEIEGGGREEWTDQEREQWRSEHQRPTRPR